MMASVKYKGRWYESTSLPLEVQIELGLKEEVKEEIDKVPKEVKKKPCKKAKGGNMARTKTDV